MVLTIADVLTRNVITASSGATLDEAANLMAAGKFSCLIAIEDQKPIGILTESDLVHVCRLGIKTESSRIEQFMSKPLIAVNRAMNIYEVYDFLLERKMRHLVVVDECGVLEGIVTLSDILKATNFDDYLHTRKICDVMKQNVMTVSVDTSLADAIKKMDSMHISCVVVTEHDKAVGIFTERDASRLLAAKQHTMACQIAEVMTSPLRTLDQFDMLVLASQTMREIGTRRLVIVDDDNYPIGIVTQFDVIRGLEGSSIRHFKRLYAETEKKLEEKTELLVVKSELERIVAASPAVLYRCRWSGDLARGQFYSTYFSPQLESMLGYTPSVFMQTPWWLKYVHPEDLHAVLVCLENILEKGEASLTYRVRSSSGDWVLILDHARLVKGSDGVPLEMVGSWLDVTQGRQVERKLTASEQRYSSLFNEARDMMHIVGADGCIIDANQIELETLGYSREEMIGKPVKELICDEFLAETEKRMAKVFVGEAQFLNETALRKKDGSCIDVEVSGTPQFDEEGNVTAVRAIMHDLTQRKASEREVEQVAERMRRVLDADFDGIIVHQNEKVVFSNKQAQQLFGYDSLAETLGENAMNAFLPAQRSFASRVARRAIRKWEPTGRLEMMGVSRGNPEPFPMEIASVPIEWEGSPALVSVVRDISQRKAVEEKLARSEAKYRSLVDNLKEVVFQTDEDGNWLFLNRAWEEVTGFKVEESLGELFLNYIYPDDRDLNVERFKPLIDRKKESCRHEIRYRHKDGGYRWIEVFARLTLDENDQVTGTTGMLSDVTERKAIQIQLESERSAMRAILNNLPFLAWLKDEHSTFLAVNDNFAQACGFERAEALVGKTDLDIWPQELANAYRHDDREVMGSGKAKQVEEMVEAEGKRHCFETFKSPIFDVDGKVVGTAGMARDITERLNSEEQMRLLESAVAAVNESIIITDVEGVIEYVNPSFTSNTGYAANEAIGRTPAILNSKQQGKGFYEKFWQTIKGGKPWSGRILDRRKDGTIFPVHLSVAPIFANNGEISHFVAVHEDLTEAEIMQKRMMQSQKMEAVGTMVGGVAHDFNNLLASIVGNLYLLRKHHQDDEKTVRRIKGMESSVQHGAQLIQQMLTFARKDRTEMHGMDLKGFVKEAYKLAHASIPENVSFQLDYPSGQSFWIRGDATQLQQVLLNMVTNAFHAVKDCEKPEIELKVDAVVPGTLLLARHAEVVSDGDWCCLSFSDNGCGIKAELLERIYEPFFTTKEVGEGTGLGLAMVYGAVQNHKGMIDVESMPGEGTCFSIYLPLHQARFVKPQHQDDAEVDGQGVTVLLVDDEEELRKVLVDVLRHNGFRILQACDGEHAVEVFEKHESDIDLVLMDVVMPNKGGVVAAREIRDMNETVPIVFQTGYGEQTQLQAAASIANSDSLQKPVQIPTLMKLILHKIDGRG